MVADRPPQKGVPKDETVDPAAIAAFLEKNGFSVAVSHHSFSHLPGLDGVHDRFLLVADRH